MSIMSLHQYNIDAWKCVFVMYYSAALLRIVHRWQMPLAAEVPKHWQIKPEKSACLYTSVSTWNVALFLGIVWTFLNIECYSISVHYSFKMISLVQKSLLLKWVKWMNIVIFQGITNFCECIHDFQLSVTNSVYCCSCSEQTLFYDRHLQVSN